jgi:dTDP-4-amino-4,6-dideoxygalactose transaminase
MWPAKQLDIGWLDLAGAAGTCLSRRAPAAEAGALEQRWAGDSGLACLSVRSGFDLLLAALELPAGSEILMSAVTIPDMVRIVDHHGLVAVPIDLDLDTLAPQLEMIEAAITPKTRAIVVAHLFGSRVPLAPMLEIARRHELVCIEDLAQGFAGPGDFKDSGSDAALLSFGPIKTATALGGALARVRNPDLLDKMRRLAAGHPVQSSAAYLRRVLKFGLLKCATTWASYTAIVALLRAVGGDHDRLSARLVRGFPTGDLFSHLRQRPCAALSVALSSRLARFDSERLRGRGERGRNLANRLANRFLVPGHAAAEHSHWIFPVLASDPQRLIERLGQAGYHATQGRSMCAIPAPADRPDLEPRNAQRLLREGVFLPVYPELPAAELERLVGVLLDLSDDSVRQPTVSAAAPAPAIAPRPS